MPDRKDIPRYNIHEFTEKRTKYCLGIFVLNEGERIQRQLKKCRSITTLIDVLIADGGSTDSSLDETLLKDCGVRVLLTKDEKGALGTQIRMAMHYALREGYGGLVVMDGNNKDDPTQVLRFIQALDAGFDHIQGSRFIAQGVAMNTPISRTLAIKLIHAPLISLAAARRYTDTTNGFRAYSRQLMTSHDIAPLRRLFTGYELHYYLAIRAAKKGYSTIEVPVSRVYPKVGKTPTKITPIRGNIKVLIKLFRVITGHYNP